MGDGSDGQEGKSPTGQSTEVRHTYPYAAAKVHDKYTLANGCKSTCCHSEADVSEYSTSVSGR